MSTVFSSPQLSKTKSSINLLERIKYEQSTLEEQLAIEYLNRTLKLSINLGQLQQELKDGVILCNLLNHIRPGTIKMVNQKSDFAVIQMDNISRFLQGVRQLGMESFQLFEPSDLYTGKDMSSVIHTILALAEFSTQANEKEHVFLEPIRDSTSRPPKSPFRSKNLSQRRPSVPLLSQPVTRLKRSTSVSSVSPKSSTINQKSFGSVAEKSTLDLDRKDEHGRKVMLLDEKGNTLSCYQLGNCIGKGQFGSVYRGLDLSTGEVIAVKRVKLEDENLYKEIMKEVDILKTLSHSNVIKYIGFIPNDDYLNIILEYAENGSLMSTLKAFGAFPEKLVASFCLKILKGLEYLHENDVIHCDLKAANILTTKTGDVKLTDFGVSLNLKLKSDDADQVSGTPNWMAPEVIELKGATTKSDIWSLGCTLIELVTGKPPYSDLLPMSAMFRIVEDDCPPLPENITQDMKDFLLCCFKKDSNERSSSKELQNHPWIQKSQKRKSEKKAKETQNNVSNLNIPDSIHREALKKSSLTKTKNLKPKNGDGFYSLNTSILHSVFDDNNSHKFIETSFGKVIECKVCNEIINIGSLFCEVCSLVCHQDCKKSAFSCPPKVKDQQPSYDWVFSAKIYNRSHQERKSTSVRGQLPSDFGAHPNKKKPYHTISHGHDIPVKNHPQAESIRKYSIALGLTAQEQLALCENQALLDHTISMEKFNSIDESLKLKFMKKRNMTFKKGQDEQCSIM